MPKVSTEEAFLTFLGKVKNDPGTSRLFREAAAELEDALGPQPSAPKSKPASRSSSSRRTSRAGGKSKPKAGKPGTQGG